ncbi:CinA family protein [Paraglaciecola sp.]|uniref:CinA family protein n=1 Tax=Paraglaciecola sp. TaxID=1920173 RepID=UPI003EFAFDE8
MNEDIHYLAKMLGEKLLDKDWTISCAESCTGGGIGYAITCIAGSSAWFNRGFITYSNEAKQSLLDVKADTLNTYGAVSEQTVAEMAVGAATKAQSNISISVSGIAGPDGGTIDKPVGTVWFGFFFNGEVIKIKQHFNGNRDAVRIKAIEFSLSNILKLLRK